MTTPQSAPAISAEPTSAPAIAALASAVLPRLAAITGFSAPVTIQAA